jgi:hypothetical protein
MSLSWDDCGAFGEVAVSIERRRVANPSLATVP